METKGQNIVLVLSIALLFVTIGFSIYQKQKEYSDFQTANLPSAEFWKLFEQISMERKYIESEDLYYRIPVFTEELKEYSGKEIVLNGYYLPYSKLDSVVIISRYPNKSCFFCGQAGIESVAMVELGRAVPKYRMDQMIVAKGKLELNSSNFKKLAFVLEEAEVTESLE